MQDMPLVSVIVPVYKTERYLHRCIDSLVNQDYKNIEIILIDDGSPDHCGNICDEYAKKDKRIRVIHQENQGISAARNAGIKKSCGEYICFVDSDDYVDIHLLSTVIPQMIEKNADAAIFNAQIVHGNIHGEILGWNIRSGEIQNDQIKQYLLQGYDSYVWRKIYKRNIWDNIIFPVGKKYEDLYIITDLVQNIDNIIAIPRILYYYEREEHGSITQDRTLDSVYNECEAWIHNMNSTSSDMNEWYYINFVHAFISGKLHFSSQFKGDRFINMICNMPLRGKDIHILYNIHTIYYIHLQYYVNQYQKNRLQYHLFKHQYSLKDQRKIESRILHSAIRVYSVNYIIKKLKNNEIEDVMKCIRDDSAKDIHLSIGQRFLLFCIKKQYHFFILFEGRKILKSDKFD